MVTHYSRYLKANTLLDQLCFTPRNFRAAADKYGHVKALHLHAGQP